MAEETKKTTTKKVASPKKETVAKPAVKKEAAPKKETVAKLAVKKEAAPKKVATKETTKKVAETKVSEKPVVAKKAVSKSSTTKKVSKPKKVANAQVDNKVVVRENRRKTLVGTVVSIKNNKTITVMVETYRKHPLYLKRFKNSKKFAVHDENNTAKVGDVVKIQETRPLSKTKHFRLVEVRSHAIGGNDNA